ncbi:hypothetical protein [Pelosinus sp. sgz500959]|uniref:hypothetical protein n=1 Tax=Pelosinus sp. sgz500959 TaxID=3242472 RepID=UPI00366FDFB7
MKLQDLHKDSKKYLSAGQVAELYGINRSSVITACNKGRMNDNEAVNTVLGWLITPSGAERLWGDRK